MSHTHGKLYVYVGTENRVLLVVMPKVSEIMTNNARYNEVEVVCRLSSGLFVTVRTSVDIQG